LHLHASSLAYLVCCFGRSAIQANGAPYPSLAASSQQLTAHWMSHVRALAEDLYQVLGVSATATFAEIRGAYRRAALRTHPDKGGSVEDFRLVAVAFEALSHEKHRALYDRRRAKRATGEAPGSSRESKEGADGPQQCGPREAATARCFVEQGTSSDPQHWADASTHDRTSATPKDPEEQASGEKHSVFPKVDIEAALERLRIALQALASERRRLALDGLEECVRARLLKFMELWWARQAHKPQNIAVVAEPLLSSDEQSDAASESSSSDSISGYDGGDALCIEDCDYISDSEEASTRGRPKLPEIVDGAGDFTHSARRVVPRGVETMKGPRLKATLYRANLSFANLRLHTKFQPDLGIAVDHHITLVLIRRAAMGSMQRDKKSSTDGDAIKSACLTVFAERGTSADDLGLSIATRLVLLDRRTILAQKRMRRDIVVHSPVLSLDEALVWRLRLISSRRLGWESFRPVWVELLLHSKFRRRAMTVEQATAFVEEQWKCLEAHWWRMEERRSRIHTRQALDDDARADRRVARAAVAVRRCLEAESMAARRSARESLRARRRLSDERWRWVKRKDTTMEEMLRGLPPHLRRNDGGDDGM